MNNVTRHFVPGSFSTADTLAQTGYAEYASDCRKRGLIAVLWADLGSEEQSRWRLAAMAISKAVLQDAKDLLEEAR